MVATHTGMPPALKTGSAEDFGHVASLDTNAATNAATNAGRATRRDVVGWTVRVIASEPAAKGGFTEYLLEVQVAGLVKNIVRKRCRAGLSAGPRGVLTPTVGWPGASAPALDRRSCGRPTRPV